MSILEIILATALMAVCLFTVMGEAVLLVVAVKVITAMRQQTTAVKAEEDLDAPERESDRLKTQINNIWAYDGSGKNQTPISEE